MFGRLTLGVSRHRGRRAGDRKGPRGGRCSRHVDAVGVAPEDDAVAVVVGVVPAAQPELDTVLVSIVTAPFRARALPDTRAPRCRLMLVRARMFPANVVFVKEIRGAADLPEHIAGLSTTDQRHRRASCSRKRAHRRKDVHPSAVERECSGQLGRRRIAIDARCKRRSAERHVGRRARFACERIEGSGDIIWA